MLEQSVCVCVCVPGYLRPSPTYQGAARDGLHQGVEDVDGQPQQRGAAVHDGLVHVVLKEEETQ